MGFNNPYYGLSEMEVLLGRKESWLGHMCFGLVEEERQEGGHAGE